MLLETPDGESVARAEPNRDMSAAVADLGTALRQRGNPAECLANQCSNDWAGFNLEM